MTKRNQTAISGPRCPGCGKAPYDIVSYVQDGKGPPMKVTKWFCPDVNCNPWGKVMTDSEVWA